MLLQEGIIFSFYISAAMFYKKIKMVNSDFMVTSCHQLMSVKYSYNIECRPMPS